MLALTLALAPRVVQNSPVGRLKKRLLAACRKRFDSGFESLLCPFFHRLSFDPVPGRSFPDLTISGVKKNNHARSTTCGPTTDDAVAPRMTSEFFRIRAILFWQKVVLFHIKYKMRESKRNVHFLEAVLFSSNYNYFSV